MEGMSRGLDFEKMEAAFKRAAEKAMRGTREERSGRFLLVEGPDISRYNLFRESRGDSMTGKEHELYVERRRRRLRGQKGRLPTGLRYRANAKTGDRES